MVELYSERLIMRTLAQSDWSNFLSVYQDPILNQYVGINTVESALAEKFQLRLNHWKYESGDWLLLVIEDAKTGNFIGFTGFRSCLGQVEHAEVGYMLGHAGQGQGFATESLNAVIDWACLRFSPHKFIGLCAKDNIASCRVLEKCGFLLEGVLRDNLVIDGRWIDDCTYGLLSSERV